MSNDKPVITVLCDTKEQRSSHVLAGFSLVGVHFINKNLKQGDYSFIYDSESYENKCLIERKNGLLEFCGSLCSGRKRFEAEFVRAIEAGAKMYLLIEDAEAKQKMLLRKKYDKYIKKINNKWIWIENEEFPKITLKKALNQTWKSFFTATSMINSIISWKEKYKFEVIFCNKKKTAEEMLKVFYKAIEEEETTNAIRKKDGI